MGHGFVEVTAGARGPLGGGLSSAFVRGEVGAHLAPAVSLFAFGEATLTGWSTGAALRGTF